MDDHGNDYEPEGDTHGLCWTGKPFLARIM
jgi:hypothetical protein